MGKRWTFLTLALIIIVTALALFMMWPRVRIESGQSATITYADKEETCTLDVSAEEADRLCRIVGGRALHKDEPSCGFSASFSFSIGERAFYIAGDECPILREAKTGLYVNISEDDRKWIDKLFQKYSSGDNHG